MAETVKLGHYDPNNLASVALHFGKLGEDAPVLALLENGADPNATDRYGFTALHRAVQFDRQAVVSALLDAGADPDCSTKLGITPLMKVRSSTAACMLLNAGADIHAVTVPNRSGVPTGTTALMWAVQSDREVAATLLEYGAATHPRDERGRNALMLAAWNGTDEIVRLLLDAGANVGLVEAALLGDMAQVRTLLAAGAGLHLQEMENALRWAAAGGQCDIVALLLDNGASTDAPDDHGKTALMQAVRHGRTETMRLLLEHGADPLARNNAGSDALDVARRAMRRGRKQHKIEQTLPVLEAAAKSLRSL